MHSNHFSVVKPAVCRHCAGIVPAPHKKEKKEENNCAGAAPAPPATFGFLSGEVRIFFADFCPDFATNSRTVY